MKLTVAAVTLAVFVISGIFQSTQIRGVDQTKMTVASVVVPVTTARSLTPTVPLNVTTIVALEPTIYRPTTTVLEPWVMMPTTTMEIVLASHEPRTKLERLICDSKWEWDCGEAIAVAQCESNMNPSAISKPNTNGTIDRGLFQINDVWEQAWPSKVWDRILIARTNIAMAHHAWKVGNESWMYWTCQP